MSTLDNLQRKQERLLKKESLLSVHLEEHPTDYQSVISYLTLQRDIGNTNYLIKEIRMRGMMNG